MFASPVDYVCAPLHIGLYGKQANHAQNEYLFLFYSPISPVTQ
jgi:hypothetical protein